MLSCFFFLNLDFFSWKIRKVQEWLLSILFICLLYKYHVLSKMFDFCFIFNSLLGCDLPGISRASCSSWERHMGSVNAVLKIGLCDSVTLKHVCSSDSSAISWMVYLPLFFLYWQNLGKNLMELNSLQ